MKIITKRLSTVIKDQVSRRITLTNELIDMGFDIESDDKIFVSLVEFPDRAKRIVIEKVNIKK